DGRVDGEAYGQGGLGLEGVGRDVGGDGGLLGKGGSGGSPPAPPGGEPAADRFVAKDLKLDDLPPPAVPQTGEGPTNWSGPSWSMTLDRAVKADESIGLWLVVPAVSKALALLRALA